MSQLVYTEDPPVALEGQIADSSRNTERITGKTEEAGGVPFGRFVTVGTDDGGNTGRAPQVRLPDLTGEISGGVGIGFSVLDTSLEQADTPLGYENEVPMQIMRRGRMWVVAEDAVAFGAAVFVRFTAGGGEFLGRVRSDVDAGDAVALPGATFRGTTTGADELVIVEYDPTL